MLLWLLTHGHGSKKALRTAASAAAGRPATNNTVKTMISTLRRKLQPHGIAIDTLSGIGYGLDGGARDKVDKILAEHGVELRPRQKTKPHKENGPPVRTPNGPGPSLTRTSAVFV